MPFQSASYEVSNIRCSIYFYCKERVQTPRYTENGCICLIVHAYAHKNPCMEILLRGNRTVEVSTVVCTAESRQH